MCGYSILRGIAAGHYQKDEYVLTTVIVVANVKPQVT